MDDQPDSELIHEVYARFGLAYYQSECLHRGLCMVYAISGLPPRDLITHPRVEEQLAHAYSLTLGDVTAKLAGILPHELNIEAQKAVEMRNFLAHQFWFERAPLMFNADKIFQLIAEIDAYAEAFVRLDARVSEWSEPKMKELGITDDLTQDYQRRLLAGESEEPLPGRQAVRELEKKLGKRQRLIRVWRFALEDGGRPLIFELADGTLWQLSDVGLGWTRFKEVGPKWTDLDELKPHLPADIIPRPKSSSPWDYEFMLANNVVLWVKPGREKKTFTWGIRMPVKRLKNESTAS
jgi:hypothetical protein